LFVVPGAGVFLEAVGDFLGFELGAPVAIAALFPFGEVLLGDGFGFEVLLEDGFRFGEGIEPADEIFLGIAFVEAVVEFFADGAREAGDFASAGRFHVSRWLMVES
jgi:hypothetical protein